MVLDRAPGELPTVGRAGIFGREGRVAGPVFRTRGWKASFPMLNLLVQIAGLVAMLALIAGGYARWIRPRHLDLAGRSLLLLVVLTLVGGLLGSTGWWIDDPRSFSWTLPPLASRM